MKKILLILAFCPSVALAVCPEYTYQTPPAPPGLNDEVSNMCHQISYPSIVYGTANNLTVTSLSVSTMTVSSAAVTTNLTVPNGINSTDAAAFGQIPVSHYPQIAAYFTENTGKTTTSTSFVDTLTTLSITPTSSSSKIKICFGGPFSTNNVQNCFFGIKRGASTQLIVHDNSPFLANANGFTSEMSGCWLDSPSTTSSTAYTVELAVQSTNTCNFGSTAAGGSATWISLEEVK